MTEEETPIEKHLRSVKFTANDLAYALEYAAETLRNWEYDGGDAEENDRQAAANIQAAKRIDRMAKRVRREDP